MFLYIEYYFIIACLRNSKCLLIYIYIYIYIYMYRIDSVFPPLSPHPLQPPTPPGDGGGRSVTVHRLRRDRS